ncbi:hypothetical protein [Actinophytocola sediminis]
MAIAVVIAAAGRAERDTAESEPTSPARPAKQTEQTEQTASDTREDAPAPAVAPEQTPSGPDTTMSDGMYQVGVDVAPGRYKTTGPDDSSDFAHCYWARTTDDSGELRSIIANSLLQGPGSVTVNAGEFIELNGGCTWTNVGATP